LSATYDKINGVNNTPFDDDQLRGFRAE